MCESPVTAIRYAVDTESNAAAATAADWWAELMALF